MVGALAVLAVASIIAFFARMLRKDDGTKHDDDPYRFGGVALIIVAVIGFGCLIYSSTLASHH